MVTSSSAALKNAAAGVPPPPPPPARTALDLFSSPKVQQGLAEVAGSFLTPQRLLRLVTNAIHRTPLLLKCDPATVLGAVMMTAALGLEPNTPQQLAFLIPYKRKIPPPPGSPKGARWGEVYECQYQVGARGFIALAYRSPYVKSFQAGAVREGDVFDHMEGSEVFLRYKKSTGKRGALTCAWALVKLTSGEEIAYVLPVDELHKIRARSETYKSLVDKVGYAENENDRRKAQAKLDETPWVMWEDDMAIKSVIKKIAKRLPLAPNDALQIATTIDDGQDVARGAIDLRAMADAQTVRQTFDGDEPPALPDDPSQTIDVDDAREREPVGAKPDADGVVAGPPASAAPPAARAPAPKAAKGAETPAAAPAAPTPPAERKPDAALVKEYCLNIGKAGTRDQALQFLDEARSTLTAHEAQIVANTYAAEWPEGR